MNIRVGVQRRVALDAMMVFALMAGIVAGSMATAGSASAQTRTQPQTSAQAVSSIAVLGNKRVDVDTIRSYFQPRPGEKLDAAKIDEGLKALYATGLYADVKISQSGGRLTITVVENATINRIAFEGNKKVKDEVLTAEVQSRVRGALSRPTVQADVQRIVEIYRRQGMFNIRVEPKIIEQPSGRVDLVFEINEGEKTTIKRIAFVGNKDFSDWKLRDTITTGQSNWLSFLNNKDVYDPDRVSADQEILRRFYLKNGYADFRVLSATVDLDRSAGGFILTFTLDEGQQYRFGTIDVVSNLRDVDTGTLLGLLRTKSGSVYNAEQVEKSIEDVTIELAKRGYAFAQMRPRGDRDFEAHRINIVYVIEEGSRVYVERINIRGNIRTRDWVIRREFDLYEGDPYNRALIDRAERRLKNLGYFKTVKMTNEPGSAPDRVIINVDVEEQLTGDFSISGGYSTQDGFIAEVGVGEKNFLGRGQYVRVSGSYGQRVRGAQLSFTEPYFMGYRIAAGFDIFTKANLQSSYQPYDTHTTGLTLRAGFPLREDLTIGGKYSIYQRDVTVQSGWRDGCKPGIDPIGGTNTAGLGNCYDAAVNWQGTGAPGNANEASVAFLQFQGKSLTSLAGYWVNYNTRDNNLDPTSGGVLTIAQDFAGLGGDINFIRTTGVGSYYYPVSNDLTAKFALQAGHVMSWGGQQLRILDHFFQGANLVRGFAPSGLGPRDLGSPNQDSLGASLYWGANAELQFPLYPLPREVGIRGAIFADAGSAWNYKGATDFASLGVLAPTSCPSGSSLKTSICLADSNSIRASVGASLIWQSPFGPLRFDFAQALMKEKYDKTQFFRFGGGTSF